MWSAGTDLPTWGLLSGSQVTGDTFLRSGTHKGRPHTGNSQTLTGPFRSAGENDGGSTQGREGGAEVG